MIDLALYHYEAAIRAMYWMYERAKATGAKSDSLEAAGYADYVVDGASLYPQGSGSYMINIGNGKSVSLKQAERDAYTLLKHRSEIATSNIFQDNGKRWFH